MGKDKMSESEEAELRKNPINIYTCSCGKAECLSFKDFRKHLLDEHQLSGKLEGNRQMTMHMDGSQWYSYNYIWTLKSGLVFHQFIKMARDKDDYMRFGD